MEASEDKIIFYEPIFGNIDLNVNTLILYSDILNKINKKFDVENLSFQNFYFLRKENKENLKKLIDNYKIFFDQDFTLTRDFKEEIKQFFQILSENEDIDLKKGYLKRYYCPQCGNFLNKYDIYTKKKNVFLHSLKLNVEESVKPMMINIINLIDLLKASKFGIKGSDFANKNAILPILGSKTPIFQVDNLNRPEVFLEYSATKEFSNIPETKKNIIKSYEDNPTKLEKDLKAYGAYEQKSKKTVEIKYCKKCNHQVQKRLIESYYIDFNELGQNYSLKTKEYILPLNISEKNNFLSNTSFEVYNCKVCDFYSFEETEICTECGNDLIKNNLYASYELIGYFLPFFINNKIKYYMVKESKKDLIEDINKIFSDILDSQLEVNKYIYLPEIFDPQNISPQYDNLFKKMFIIGKIVSGNDKFPNINSKLNTIQKFYYSWGKLFKKELKDKLEELDLRTDFYIEKYITTLLQKLILNEKEAAEEGALINYINNLYETIQNANESVYPYLNNIDLEQDIYTYRVSYYFYKEMILFISPFLLDYHNYPLKFPSYREDYNFEEDLDEKNFINNFIDKIIEGKRILKIKDDKKIIIWVETDDNVSMEILKTNSKYLKSFLNLENIKVYDEKEMPKKRLELQHEEFSIYLPIFDIGRIKNIIDEFKKELEDLKVKIIKNRLKLFDYDFLEKAPKNIIEMKKERIKDYLKKKERINDYLDILDGIVGDMEDENEKTGV